MKFFHNLGTFLTILQSNGNMETRIYDMHGFFVKMQDFSYDIDADSWRSVETSQTMDLPSQDLVVFKDNVNGIKLVRHVMPGMFCYATYFQHLMSVNDSSFSS
jgi:hypothetical protein